MSGGAEGLIIERDKELREERDFLHRGAKDVNLVFVKKDAIEIVEFFNTEKDSGDIAIRRLVAGSVQRLQENRRIERTNKGGGIPHR